MLLDLGRNDVGKVSKIGTVKVTERFKIEKYSHVMHIVSNVVGKQNNNFSNFETFLSGFPAGTVSGAPKIRAMEIINELEISSRGPYCGTIFWMGFDGKFDSSITIRSIIINFDEIVAQAGGAIVAESDPYQEYEEALFKANPLLNILE